MFKTDCEPDCLPKAGMTSWFYRSLRKMTTRKFSEMRCCLFLKTFIISGYYISLRRTYQSSKKAVCPATGALLYPESNIKVFSLIGIPSFRDRWGLKCETFIQDVPAGTCRRTWNQTLLETPAPPSVGTAGILGIKVFMDDALFIFQRWEATKFQNFRKRLYDGLLNLLGYDKKINSIKRWSSVNISMKYQMCRRFLLQ